MKKILIIFSCICIFNNGFSQQQNSICINEFLASNVSIDADIVDFDDYSDWIELFNKDTFDIDIGGYYLTDDPENPLKWKIPPSTTLKTQGYIRFWADGYNEIPGQTYWRSWVGPNAERLYFQTKYYHLNFKLSRKGEYIGLYCPDGSLEDSLTYSLQLPDVSMGRQPDGAAIWFYFGEPTPISSNNTPGTNNTSSTSDPVIFPPSSFYYGDQNVTIGVGSPGSAFNYSLDGSKPGSNLLFSDTSFSVSTTSIVKARSFESGKLPGNTLNQTYFINEQSTLPVISITVPPDVMFDNKYGIYPTRMADKEIPIRFEYFESNSQPAFSLNAGFSLTGQASLFYPQISFTITARSRYGTDIFNYPVFGQREINSFKSLYFRNSGVPDNRSTFFRDALQHSLVLNKIDVDCQAYQPSLVFINGNYWGIYNIREKINKYYLATLHNLDPEDVDLLEYEGEITPTVMDGNADNYTLFYQYFKNNDLALDENYRFIENWMDIDEYINYQICEIYYDNIIWPNQNMRMWRERKEDGKWRWILFDTDFGFGMPNMYSTGFTNNTLAYATSSNTGTYMAPAWSTLIFRKLLCNEEFKTKFIRRFESYLNSVFHPDTVVSIITTLQNRISPEMNRHIERWKEGENYYGFPIQSYSEWLGNVEVMKEFARRRPLYQRQHLKQYFSLSGFSVLMLNIADPGMGTVLINGAELIDGQSSGIYFRDVPVELAAIPTPGHRFVKWIGIDADSLQQVSLTLDADTVYLTAVFDTVTVSILPEYINSDYTLQKNKSPYYATGDIIVDSAASLRIEAGVDILMPEKACILVYGQLLAEGTMEEPVLFNPNEYTTTWGAICFLNASDSSALSHVKISNASRGHNYLRDRAGISGYNSNFSLTEVVFDNVVFPLFAEYGNITVNGCSFQSIAAGDLININYAQKVLVENCDFSGNDDYDSDAIDLGQVNNAIIRKNKIYNNYGFNSDGLDLGENTINALVEENFIYNIKDKGISIGTGSTATIRRNIMVNCGDGIGIKDSGSYAFIENSTFYANHNAVACFEKSLGEGGGSVEVKNCIFSGSIQTDVFTDEHSTAKISYSLSDKNLLPGFYNLLANPKFLNNLRLANGSPAINSGDPSSPLDLDGTTTDLGAIPFDPANQENLLIDEIHYNPEEGVDNCFVEIVNAGYSPVNMTGYKLTGNIEFTFPDTTVEAGELFIVAKNRLKYEGLTCKVFQWETGLLEKNPGIVLLQNKQGDQIDFVNYNCRFWWPREPDGQGPSLELHNTELENMASSSWRGSYAPGGTPGQSSASVAISGIFINEFQASNFNTHPDEKGQYSDWIECYNSTDRAINMAGLFFTDRLGSPFKYQLPFYSAKETTLPARGYILFWADGQPELGARHLDLKLDIQGEQIGLVQLTSDSALFIDKLSYNSQLTDRSYGRFPDGANNWFEFMDPTPNSSNLYTAVPGEELIIEKGYSLQNFPNPFSSNTLLSYQVGSAAEIELNIYDLVGSKVTNLVNEYKPIGNYELEWNASGMKPGIYLCELKAGQTRVVKKLILLK